jgi:hypothetical protein
MNIFILFFFLQKYRVIVEILVAFPRNRQRCTYFGIEEVPPIASLMGVTNGIATTGVYKKATNPKEAVAEELDIE